MRTGIIQGFCVCSARLFTISHVEHVVQAKLHIARKLVRSMKYSTIVLPILTSH